MSDYSAERYDPKFSKCGILMLTFDGLELTLKGPKKKTYRYRAASGKAVSGQFSYTAERQKLKDTGPIPEGSSGYVQMSWMTTGSIAGYRMISVPRGDDIGSPSIRTRRRRRISAEGSSFTAAQYEEAPAASI